MSPPIRPRPGVQRMTSDPKAARGYRNRNPGNIEHVPANAWQGLADPPSDGRFCRFHSHQHGIRALALLLRSYQDRHGLRTVRGIVARWAPSTENNTRAYQDAVAKRLAVGLDDPIDLHDAATLRGLVEAIIRHELGGQPYAPEVIAEGLRMAGLMERGIARTGTVRAAAARGPLAVIMLLLGVALLLTACAPTPSSREEVCENARLVVLAYDAANAAGERLPAKEEAMAAAVARALLEARCDVR